MLRQILRRPSCWSCGHENTLEAALVLVLRGISTSNIVPNVKRLSRCFEMRKNFLTGVVKVRKGHCSKRRLLQISNRHVHTMHASVQPPGSFYPRSHAP